MVTAEVGTVAVESKSENYHRPQAPAIFGGEFNEQKLTLIALAFVSSGLRYYDPVSERCNASPALDCPW